MKVQYRILGQLKKLDEKLYRLNFELENIPGEIAKIEAALAKNKAEFTVHKNNFETHEKTMRKAEMDLREKEDFIKKAEGKMMECKTNEEYKAAQKEIDGFKEQKGKLEETVLLSMNGLEVHRTQLKTAETNFKEQEALVNKDKKEYDTVRQKLVNSYEEQAQQKEGIVIQLSPDITALYKRASAINKGIGICITENFSCLGCNIKIRPQLFNEILGAKAVHRCPSCGRILITSSAEIDENSMAEIQL